MRYKKIIKKMSLLQKAVILSGHGKWDTWGFKALGIPSMVLSDGPHGLRRQTGVGDHLGLGESAPATCFPTASTISNSWDEKLINRVGEALGEEAGYYGVSVLLGPGINIKRSPLCGRNFEYFSEDPYLTGCLSSAMIKGIQSHGLYACAKHFAVNSQEYHRMTMNAIVDERTLREIYLTAFEIAVRQGHVKSVMTSYNKVNGIYSNENKKLLRDILRKEWGFKGFVVTDWGGSNSHVRGVAAGSTLEMPNPGFFSAGELVSAVRHGRISERVVDRRVNELLTAVFETKKVLKEKDFALYEKTHHALAREAAAGSIVLLKNEDNILPIKKKTKVALIGDFAYKPRYQGAGSSNVNSTRVDTLKKLMEKDRDIELIGASRGYLRNLAVDTVIFDEAKALAKEADVVIYCFGLPESSETESVDRRHMRIPDNQIQLLRDLCEINENVIGVLSGGAAVEMPWEESLKGLLYIGLGGQAASGAVLDILKGEISPSGHLSETYPYRYEDTPAYNYFPCTEKNPAYREGIYVGYRYYCTTGTEVRYPFGYGLSYTSFSYSGITVDESGVRFTVKNTGDADGAAVPQMYISKQRTAIFRPARELKGFSKVFLHAGEEKSVFIPFDEYTFRYWNTDSSSWETESGIYTVTIGENACDTQLKGKIKLAGTNAAVPVSYDNLPSYHSGRIKHVSKAEYARLYGQEDIFSSAGSEQISINDAISRLTDANNAILRRFAGSIKRKKNRSDDEGNPDLNLHFIHDMPLRALAGLTDGRFNKNMVKGLVEAANGRFFSGMSKLIGGLRRKRAYDRHFLKKLREH